MGYNLLSSENIIYLKIFEVTFCFLTCLYLLQVPFLLTTVLVSVFHDQHLSKTGLSLGCRLPSADQALSVIWKLWVCGKADGPHGICPRPQNVSVGVQRDGSNLAFSEPDLALLS